MVGWHHRLDGREVQQILPDSEAEGSPECCSPSGGKELDMTEQLDNKRWCTFLMIFYVLVLHL